MGACFATSCISGRGGFQAPQCGFGRGHHPGLQDRGSMGEHILERVQIEEKVVPEEGFEPSRPCGHCDLNAARLPVPPPWHRVLEAVCTIQAFFCCPSQNYKINGSSGTGLIMRLLQSQSWISSYLGLDAPGYRILCRWHCLTLSLPRACRPRL
jgi:hypothetical protein